MTRPGARPGFCSMSASVVPFFRTYPVASAIAVAAAYYFSAKFGLTLAFAHPSATAVWPPTGIALAALVLGGNRLWPAVFVAAFAANVTTAGSWATSLGIAAGNTLEALIGSTLAVRFAGGTEAFDRSASIVRWTLYCGGLAAAVSASIGVTSLCLGGFATWPDFTRIWVTWWLGDAGSSLVVAPLLILWGRDFRIRLGRSAEVALMSIAFVVLSSFVFGTPLRLSAETYPIPFAFPFLAWVAFRLGPRGTAVALAALATSSVWGTLENRGPFAGRSPHESLLFLQIFLSATAATALAVATTVEQRRQAELSFRRGEERRRLILESALDAVIIMDGAGRITDWSPRAVELFGWTRDEAAGKRLSETLLPADHRLAREWAAEGNPSSGSWGELNRRFEFEALRKDGSRLPVEISVTATRGENDAVYSAFVRDIAERRRAENARARLVAVVENSDDAIITKSLDGRITTWNQGAERLFGYTEAEAVGKSITLIIPEDLHDEEAGILLRLRRGDRIAHIETRRRTKDGRLLDVSLSISPIRDDKGVMVGASKIARDVTARKRAEAAERVLLDATRSLSASIDLDRTLEKVVRLAPAVLADGCVVEIAGEPEAPRRRVVHHRDPARAGDVPVPEAEQVLRSGAPELRSDLPPRMTLPLCAGGGTLGTLTFFSQEAGRRYGPDELALAEALTRQAAFAVENARLFRAKEDFNRVLEVQVQQRTAQLKDALAELESFSYTVAHDLRAPLRSLASFSELLKADYASRLDDAGREYVDRIAAAALRMDTLVQDLLAYSRVAREEVRLEAVELKPLVDEVLGQLDHEIRSRNADVRVEGPLPPVAANRVMLLQALTNLVGNALKFVPEGGAPRVTIDAEDLGDAVRIRVRDNGIGIAPEYHDKIFEIFERLEPGRFPGTGVGLAIVRKALDRMGGTSGVESAPGSGSRFWIELRKASAALSV